MRNTSGQYATLLRTIDGRWPGLKRYDQIKRALKGEISVGDLQPASVGKRRTSDDGNDCGRNMSTNSMMID